MTKYTAIRMSIFYKSPFRVAFLRSKNRIEIGDPMPYQLKKPCNRPGCPELVHGRFCESHKKKHQQEQDLHRGNAHQRGYTSRWSRYSKWFLRQPENVFCMLQLRGCTNLARCVDHIHPCGPDDPSFFDPDNHQAACIHCNSMKGRKNLMGEGKPFEAMSRRGE